MNVNQLANGVGDALANGSRWLLSWMPGGRPGGTFTPIQEDKASGINTNAPPPIVHDTVKVVKAGGDLAGMMYFLLIFVVVFKIFK